MGMTGSFVFLKNRGDSPDALREKLGKMNVKNAEKKKDGPAPDPDTVLTLLKEVLGLDAADIKKVVPFPGAQPAEAPQTPPSGWSIPRHNVIAYKPDVPWLPYFRTSLCDGHITRSKELVRVSETFETPVLAFAVFDSDALYLSYCDAARQQRYDYVKPNFPEFLEEFEDETYLAKFPAFLVELCGWEHAAKLREIWDAKDVVFAEDRMANILEFLGTDALYDETLEGLEGFEKLTAE